MNYISYTLSREKLPGNHQPRLQCYALKSKLSVCSTAKLEIRLGEGAYRVCTIEPHNVSMLPIL